jgi:hypothetical protein
VANKRALKIERKSPGLTYTLRRGEHITAAGARLLKLNAVC